MTSGRRWLQFSLRGLLALLSACAIGLGFVANRIRAQRSAVEKVEAMGAEIRYERDETSDGGSPWQKSVLGELHGLKGIEVRVLQGKPPHETPNGWFFTTEARSGPFRAFDPTITFDDEGLKALSELTMLESVHVENAPVTDAGLMNLASCVRLRRLTLIGTSATLFGVTKLQARLPSCEISFSPSPE